MRRFIILFVMGMLSTGVAGAADAYALDWEVTPVVGYAAGGRFEDSASGASLKIEENPNYGIILDANIGPDSQLEFYYSHQPTALKAGDGFFAGESLFDIDMDYIHFGGTYGVAYGKVKPYVASTLGVTHMNPKRSGLDSETRFSLSLGGGVKVFFTDHIGLRLEGRGFGTYFDGSWYVFCGDGGCEVRVRSHVFFQFTGTAGLIIAF